MPVLSMSFEPALLLLFAFGLTTNAAQWITETPMPLAYGEVTSAVVDGILYVFGTNTLGYNISQKQWLPINSFPDKKLTGDHHSAVVYQNRVFLIGGLDGTSGGRIQVYDPKRKKWWVKASLKYKVGSTNTALIKGKIYVCGGIVGYGGTTAKCVVFDPASNAVTNMTNMPVKVNHAAASTDGANFWIFSGRQAGNYPTNGLSIVQRYTPATNTWVTSKDGAFKPIPARRGGMGTALYISGKFYVIGGETYNLKQADANHVYNRVDIYNPFKNSWSRGSNLTFARHGIYPAYDSTTNAIFVAGGGVKSGNSQSAYLEVLYL